MLKLGLDPEIKDSLLINCLLEEIEKGNKLPFPKIDFYSLRGTVISDYIATIELPSPVFSIDKTKKILVAAPVTNSEVLVSGKVGYFELLNRDKRIIYRGLVSNKKLEDSPCIVVNNVNWDKGDILNMKSINLIIS